MSTSKCRSYLVTGGAGFIGSNIVEELINRGQRVRVIDNLSTGRIENISPILNEIEFVEGDIRDLKSVRKTMRGIEFVLHQAALPSVQRSIEDPITTTDNNVTGTLNVLVAARDAGIKRVVYASSSSVYGDTQILPKTEDMQPNPLSPYAISKLVGEHYCKVFHRIYGLESVMLRYFNVFGPKQDPASQYAAVIPKFVKLMLKEDPPVVFGDGEQTRDFTYIDNVVDANILACFSAAAAGEIINVACQESMSLNEIVRTLNLSLGKDITPIFSRPRSGDIKHSLADINKAKNLLNYEPKVRAKEGLGRLVKLAKGHSMSVAKKAQEKIHKTVGES